jgi:hypothetical protein
LNSVRMSRSRVRASLRSLAYYAVERSLIGSLAASSSFFVTRRLLGSQETSSDYASTRGTKSKSRIWDQVSTEAYRLSQKTDGLYNVKVTQSRIRILLDVVTTHIASLLSLPLRSHTKNNGNHASFNTLVRNCLMIRATSHRAVSSAK